jgi:hypothetical protein
VETRIDAGFVDDLVAMPPPVLSETNPAVVHQARVRSFGR